MSNTNVAVALLYETQELGRHLREALTSLGTPIVYEAAPANLDRDALEHSGARVVIVNLDSDVEAHLDEVYGLLEDERYSVVFNDAQASSALSGWDQARWARHLAAKILGDADIDPPRPEGAEAVPAPVAAPAEAIAAATDEDTDVEDIELASEPEAGYDVRLRSIDGDGSDEPTPVASAAGNPLEQLESRYEEMNQSAATSYPSPTPPPADEFDFSTLEALTAVSVPASAAASEPALAPEFLDIEPAQGDAPEFAETADDATVAYEFAEEPASAEETPAVPSGVADFDLDDLDKLFGDATIVPAESSPVDVGDLQDFSAVDPIEFDDVVEDTDTTAVSGLSLAGDIAFDAPPPPAAAPPPAISMKLAAAADWSLEDMLEGDGPPPLPASGPANFGIEKVSAAEYLAPSTENAAPPPVPEGDFAFELMPMEEAVAPQPVQREVQETWLDPSKVVLPPKIRKVWVLGASIGGPEAVRDFLRDLPRDYPALFLLAQHMGVEFVDLMAQQLAKATPLTVRTPTHGERVGHGEVVIVPTTHRLQVDPEGIVVLERINNDGAYSPSIDLVLRDVADRYGANANAIIFSGMTTDSVEGTKYLAGKGGTVFAQHPDSCVVSSMIDGVIEAGIVKFLGTPKELAEQLLSESPKGKR